MSDRRHGAPRGRAVNEGSLANESGLAALGTAVAKAKGGPRPKRKRRRARRIVGWTAVTMVVVLVLGAGGFYWYVNHELDKIKRVKVAHLFNAEVGQPFNVLIIGSDSRAGLSGLLGKATGAGGVSGQRSDAIKIMHVDPIHHTISMISIPRDTLVTLLANQSLYGQYNRINVNYGGGPSLLVKTIEANFGIPINHVIQVSFAGLVNAADSLGGVYLDFPYPAKDNWSQLHIHHAGCQLVKGFQTLAVVRSRHYEWFQNGVWNYDGTSDYGRIQRQDTFIRALMISAKSQIKGFNLPTVLSFIDAFTKGIAVDSTMTNYFMESMAYDFRNFQASQLHTYMLPVVSDGDVAPIGDVLSVDQPYAQQLLVQIFGNELMKPTVYPPNGQGQPIIPPTITPTTTTSSPTTTSTVHHKHHGATTTVPTTTTTLVPAGYDYFNPVPCEPK
jgi:LCP family protein required for cell wall assembly